MSKSQKIIAASVFLGLAATLYLVPGLIDRVLYDHVGERCWGTITLSGVQSGRYCRGSAVLNAETVGMSALTTSFAGQGHLVVYGRSLSNQGRQRPVAFAVVRTPGDDGRWFCASRGTITTRTDLSTELRLWELREMAPGRQLEVTTASLDKSVGPCDHSGRCVTTATGGLGTDRMTVSRRGPRGDWTLHLRAREPGSFHEVVEAVSLRAVGPQGVTVAYRAGEGVGSAKDVDREPTVRLALTDFGRCGPNMKGPLAMDGEDELELEIDWDN